MKTPEDKIKLVELEDGGDWLKETFFISFKNI